MLEPLKYTPLPWKVDEKGVLRGGTAEQDLGHVKGVEDYPCLDPDEHDMDAIERELSGNRVLVEMAPLMYEALRFIAQASIERGELGDRTALDVVIGAAQGVLARMEPQGPISYEQAEQLQERMMQATREAAEGKSPPLTEQEIAAMDAAVMEAVNG